MTFRSKPSVTSPLSPILLAAIIAPFFVQMTSGNFKRWFLGTYESTVEIIAITYVAITYWRKNNTRDISIVLWIIGILACFIGDTYYSFDITQGRLSVINFPDWMLHASELLFLTFLVTTTTYLFRGSKKHGAPLSFTEKFIICILFTIHAWISVKYILGPFFVRQPNNPTIYFKITGTLYTISESFLFAGICIFTLRTRLISDFLALQGLQLAILADFALRSQDSTKTVTKLTWNEVAWAVGLSAYVIITATSTDSFLRRPHAFTKSFYSVRAALSLAVSTSTTLFLFGILLFDLSIINNAVQLSSILLLIFLNWFFANLLALRLSNALIGINGLMLDPEVQTSEIERLKTVEMKPIRKTTNLYEIDELVLGYNRLGNRTNTLISTVIEQNRKATIGEVASQVSHDIRSPLAALGSVFDSKMVATIPEHDRIVIRSALNRIRDIANSLLERASTKIIADNQHISEPEANPSEPQLLYSLLDAVVSEKRMQYRSQLNIDISFSDVGATAYALFACVSRADFARVLSNLINNAVEAIPSTRSGIIRITLTAVAQTPSFATVQISDNGCGIHSDDLNQIGAKGISIGKQTGHGLGLAHAFETVRSWGGQLKLESTPNVGTVVTLQIPRAGVPAWFAPQLNLHSGATILALDDDASIHGIWRRRIDDLGPNANVALMNFSNTSDFSRYVSENRAHSNSHVYLIDYELLGEKVTGLDVIERLKLEPAQTTLATSRFEEPEIRARVERLGIRMIPKSLAAIVPFELVPTALASRQAERFDAIVIDDDTGVVHTMWNMTAKRDGKKVKCFLTIDEFMRVATTIDRSTPIFVDSNLGGAERGEVDSRRIAEMGFTRIYLATGSSAAEIIKPHWILEIVGKAPRWV